MTITAMIATAKPARTYHPIMDNPPLLTVNDTPFALQVRNRELKGMGFAVLDTAAAQPKAIRRSACSQNRDQGLKTAW